MQIIICEEEEVLLTAIEFRLQKNGYQSLRTKSSDEAFDLIKNEDPKLMILDLHISNDAAFKLLKKMKADRKVKLPVVALSNLENPDDLLDSFDLGVTDFITKPFKPVELIIRIKKILG